MADKKISQMIQGNPLTGLELFYADDLTNDVQYTVNSIKNFIYSIGGTTNSTSYSILLGNSAANVIVNSSILQLSNSGGNVIMTAASLAVGTISGTSVGSRYTNNTITVGNSSINASMNSTTFVANVATIGPNFIANSTGAYHTATMNAAVHSTTGVVINATHITATSNTILLGNTIGRFVITANSADIGPNFIANSTGAYHIGVMNAATSVGATFTANATLVNAAAINITGAVNTASLMSTGLANVNALNVTNQVNAVALLTTGLANLSALNVTNQINSATFFASTTANVGTIQINTTAFAAGSNCYVNTTAVRVPNTGLVTNTSATSNGYSYITGGVLMQWGWVAATSTGVQANFPIAFPTNLFQVSVTQVNATPLVNSWLSVAASNTTQITVKTGNATATNCSWIAIGN